MGARDGRETTAIKEGTTGHLHSSDGVRLLLSARQPELFFNALASQLRVVLEFDLLHTLAVSPTTVLRLHPTDGSSLGVAPSKSKLLLFRTQQKQISSSSNDVTDRVQRQRRAGLGLAAHLNPFAFQLGDPLPVSLAAVRGL